MTMPSRDEWKNGNAGAESVGTVFFILVAGIMLLAAVGVVAICIWI